MIFVWQGHTMLSVPQCSWDQLLWRNRKGELRGRQDFKGIIGFSGGRDQSWPTDYKGQTLPVFPQSLMGSSSKFYCNTSKSLSNHSPHPPSPFPFPVINNDRSLSMILARQVDIMLKQSNSKVTSSTLSLINASGLHVSFSLYNSSSQFSSTFSVVFHWSLYQRFTIAKDMCGQLKQEYSHSLQFTSCWLALELSLIQELRTQTYGRR